MTLLLLCLQGKAQGFINLTAQEVRIDSVLPSYTYQKPLGSHYADSTYTVSIEYPEFIDMTEADIQRYQQLQGVLDISFCPIVKREGKFQKLVSFKLAVKGKAREGLAAAARTRANESSVRYAEHSVLQSGTWAKIRIPASGQIRPSRSVTATSA